MNVEASRMVQSFGSRASVGAISPGKNPARMLAGMSCRVTSPTSGKTSADAASGAAERFGKNEEGKAGQALPQLAERIVGEMVQDQAARANTAAHSLEGFQEITRHPVNPFGKVLRPWNQIQSGDLAIR